MCKCKGKCRCDIKKHINIILIVVAIIVSGIATALLYDGGNSDPPGFGGSHYSKIVIDSDNNIHVFWLDFKFVDYAKLNSDGKMVIEPKGLLNITLHGHWFYNWDVKIDNTDQIHVLYNNYHVVINTNGEIISEDANATGITSSMLDPIISINDNQLMTFNENQTLDSDNNIHTVTFTYYSEGATGYNNLQYRKMSSNGTEIINKSISKDYWTARQTIIADKDNNIHFFGRRQNSIFHAILDVSGNKIKDFTRINTDELIGYFDVELNDDNISISYTGFYSDDAPGVGFKTYFMLLDSEGEVLVPGKLVSDKGGLFSSVSSYNNERFYVTYETHENEFYPVYLSEINKHGEIVFKDKKIWG